MPKMDEHSLRAVLAAERASAMGAATSSKLSSQRMMALDYYNGDMPDMQAAEGRSGAVSTDVRDVVEGMLPQLIDVFVADEDVVTFAPVGPEDVKAAEQESDYVRHVFMHENPGFLILYTMIKDALLSKTGVVKVFWEESTREERQTFKGLTADAYALLAETVEADDEAEIVESVEHSSVDDADFDESEAQADPKEATEGVEDETTYDVVVKFTRKHGQAKVVNIPPEEFLISKKARWIYDTPYCAHRRPNVTRHELIELGFDRDQINSLPQREGAVNSEEIARNTVEDIYRASGAENTEDDLVEVVEHYIKLDYEGDGVTRLYRITTGGVDGEILWRDGKADIEVVDDIPFAVVTPIILTHRFYGASIADHVLDIQRIKTVLFRSLLDNAYLTNNQRYIVSENGATDRTLDDLLTNRPGGIVRAKTVDAVMPMPTQPIGQMMFPLIEYVDKVREARTGFGEQQAGLDPKVLANTTATAVSMAMTASQARIKLIARIFAETGIKDLFMLLHGAIRKNESKAKTVRLRNSWIPIDPSSWRTRYDMTVQVGLGPGTKQDQLAFGMSVLNLQKEALSNPQVGLTNPAKVYNLLKKILGLAGWKDCESFFSDPAQQGIQWPPPPQPDPKMAEAQARVQADQVKTQGQLQLEHAKAQIGAQQTAQQAAIDADLRREQMAQEIQLKREQMAAEIQLKREQMAAEFQLKREAMLFSAQTNANIQGPEMGGQPG